MNKGTQLTQLYVVWICFVCLSFTTQAQSIFINEILASNNITLADEAGEYDDWIELYNGENQAINLAGYYLSDNETNPTKWQFPTNDADATTIPANGFLLLWADNDEEQGTLHTNFKLSAGGEYIGIFTPNGILLDGFAFDEQLADISFGREPDGDENLVFFQNPSPNASNSGGVPESEVAPLTFSIEGGYYADNQQVSITTTTPDADIYYTLTGDEPTENDLLYTAPVSIDETTTLRAKGFKTGILPSPIETHSYLFDIDHTFPVVFLSGNDADFFDEETGIYPNHDENWEIPVNVELFLTDGTQAFSQLVGAEIHGTSSDSYPQKSIALKAKNDYGDADIDFPIFEEQPEIESYRSLILRNSGQDWNATHFKDAMVTDVIRRTEDVDDMIQLNDRQTQAFMPTITYINGEYWGILNLRERMDWRYMKVHFDVDEDEIDLIVNDDEVKEGTIDNWQAVEEFYEENDMAEQVNFDSLAQLIDVKNYRDYCIFRVWNDDLDWPGNNQRRWRKHTEADKWQWMTFDVDFAFGMMTQATGEWNSGIFTQNTLHRLNSDNGFSWPNPIWSTAMFRNMIQNDNFRRDFINRSADHLNVLYNVERVVARLDSFEVLYTPEIQGQIDRWQGGFNDWDVDVQKMRTFAENRLPEVYQHYLDEFNDIDELVEITLEVSPANAGHLEWSTLNLANHRLPWTGKYFTGIDIPAEAIAAPGYYFDFWSQNADNQSITNINLNSSGTITAHFQQGSTAEDALVINEINYNSGAENAGDWVEIYNPNNYAVDISAWYFRDESNEFYGFPPNTEIPADAYYILTENAANFQAVYPNIPHIYGDFSFKLSNSGELLTLYNAAGTVIDSVRYADSSPWPTAADGTGLTLQLITPNLDNTLAENWTAIEATPGAINGEPTMQQAQSIDFQVINDKIVTDTPFQIAAAASSELPVEFSIISGPASISGNTITLDGVQGTVVVRAEQNGNVEYLPAPPVEQSFEVIPLAQFINFQPLADKETTDAPFFVVASATSSLPVAFSVVDGPASISGNTVTLEGIAGIVTIRAEQNGNATYAEAMPVEQSFEVFAVAQSIDFQPLADKFVNDVPFVISAEASSELPVEFSILSGPASIDNNIITLDGTEGTIVVRAEQNGNDTYQAAPAVEQSFEVTKVPQVIDFQDIPNKNSNDLPFEIFASTNANLSIEFTILSGPATINGSTITLNGTTGSVTVRAENAGDATYQAASVEQTFQVFPPEFIIQDIDFQPISDKIVTDAPFEIFATASSELPVTLSILSGPASISSNTITLDGVQGTVIILAEQNGDNSYAPADPVEQSFEVLPAPQSIAFQAIPDKFTNDLPFEISAITTSGLPAEFSIVSGPATVSDNIITLDGTVGTVTVQAAQSGDLTYAAAIPIEQSFEVLLFDNVEEFAEALGVQIFPNPVDNQLFIAFTNNQNPVIQAEIFTLQGQEILQEKINSNQHILQLEKLPNGSYLMRLTAENGLQASWRFVKL